MAKINKLTTKSPHYILDDNKNIKVVYDLMEWANWLETADRQIRFNRLKKYGVRVSTVFLGIDHNYLCFEDGSRTPVLFETMIFLNGKFYDSRLDGYQERYCTLDEAVKGHHRAMREVIEILKEKNEEKK